MPLLIIPNYEMNLQYLRYNLNLCKIILCQLKSKKENRSYCPGLAGLKHECKNS